MKLVIAFLVFIIVCNIGHSQTIDSVEPLTTDDNQLLSKSRWQKAIGWTILGTGLPVAVISGVLISNLTEDDWNESAGRVFFVGSLVYTLTSIPLLIAGRRNKKRALSVSFIQNKTPVAVVNAISFKMQAVFSLKLSIN